MGADDDDASETSGYGAHYYFYCGFASFFGRPGSERRWAFAQHRPPVAPTNRLATMSGFDMLMFER